MYQSGEFHTGRSGYKFGMNKAKGKDEQRRVPIRESNSVSPPPHLPPMKPLLPPLHFCPSSEKKIWANPEKFQMRGLLFPPRKKKKGKHLWERWDLRNNLCSRPSVQVFLLPSLCLLFRITQVLLSPLPLPRRAAAATQFWRHWRTSSCVRQPRYEALGKENHAKLERIKRKNIFREEQ